MFLLTVLLPLFGFLSGSLFGSFLGLGVCLITTLCTFTSFIISLCFFYNTIITGQVYILNLFTWINIDSLVINWSFCFDSLTAIMLVVVTFISTLVHIYSIEYMEKDPHLLRFMSYLSLFTFFMLILITANNFLQMFIGWEGVGVSSYLLINFWFTRLQANKAAIKAMLVNRVGDFFLLLALFTIVISCNSVDYDVVFTLSPFLKNYTLLIGVLEISILDLICMFLFLGAMGKSAQLGFHTWLPDAMEGPTPVSALIHAATMVTAGVFLLTRCSFFFEFSPLSLNFIVLIGALTAFFAATTGLFQNDIKKVIAYSTCSQLGYMIFACGLSSYDVGMFHLYNHAFFKALLFLTAGSIIHSLGDEQDMRKMGGIKNTLPFAYSVMLVGSLALIGFPFLAGFYSKDTILEICIAKQTIYGNFAFFLGTFAAFCTAFYSTRLLFLVFLSNASSNKNILINSHESGWKMAIPLFILCLLSVLIGFFSTDLLIGFGTDFWGSSIYTSTFNYSMSDIEFINFNFKILPLIVTIFGCLTSYFLYRYKLSSLLSIKKSFLLKYIYNFFNKKWYFDRIYNQILNQIILILSYNYFYQDIDRGLIEQTGPFGTVKEAEFYFPSVLNKQTGFILHYIIYMVLSSITLLLIVWNNVLIVPLFICLYIMLYKQIIA
jgi:NADH-ubiquinone oxidoreductase chain 5